MIDHIHWITQLFGALIGLGWRLALLIGVILLIKSLLQLHPNARKVQTGKKLGFLQVNESVRYRLKRALNRRRTSGQLGAEDVMGEESEATQPSTTAAARANTDSKDCIAHDGEPCKRLRAEAYASALPVAVIQVNNDSSASQRKVFAKMVDEVIANKSNFSRVIVDASSPGGTVTGYGLMFTEMERLRNESGLYVTGVADDVAASGGMLQLLPAHEIVMPPYAMVGSIGVVTEFLNFHQLLKTLGIEPIELTAGKFKRTITQFGEPTDEKREHFTEQLKAIHSQFITSVTRYRTVDPDKVCNGDHWSAQESIDNKLGLVDRLGTSRQLMFDANQDHDLVILSESSSPWERVARRFIVMVVDAGISQLSTRFGQWGRL
jgi:signal peptide peptidase SppA